MDRAARAQSLELDGWDVTEALLREDHAHQALDLLRDVIPQGIRPVAKYSSKGSHEAIPGQQARRHGS
jgi:hypothetical protein